MSQDIRNKFIFIAILTAVCGYIVAPIPNKPKVPLLSEARMGLGIDLAGGAELRYRILYEPGATQKERTTALATDVIRKRIEGKHLVKEPKINSQGDDQIIVQMAGIDQDTLKEYKRLIITTGKLELFAVAPKEIQEKYNREKVAPEGYEPIDNTERSHGGPEDPYGGPKLELS